MVGDSSVNDLGAPVPATSPRVQARIPADLHAAMLAFIAGYNATHYPAALTIDRVVTAALRQYLLAHTE